MNTKKRMEAKNEFEENFFKLMINSVFGKASESIEILNKWQQMKKEAN